MKTARIKLTIAYVGTNYKGWQIQEKANAPSTIQGELEKIVSPIIGNLVRIHGSGRTDAGVHADAQVAHMDIPAEKANLDWSRIFNTNLPNDIRVLNIEKASANFHARFDAQKKAYTYQLWTKRLTVPPRIYPFVWDCGELDLDSIKEGASYLMGSHNYSSFQNSGTNIQDTVRCVETISFLDNECISPNPYNLAIRFEANGFLKQMVRNMVGLLVAVGQGKLKPVQIKDILLACDRCTAPMTAPARGLTLREVFY